MRHPQGDSVGRACREVDPRHPGVAREDPHLDKQTDKDAASRVGARPHGSRFRAGSIDSTLLTVSILGVPWEAYKTWERCRGSYRRDGFQRVALMMVCSRCAGLRSAIVEGCRLQVRDAICPWLPAGQRKEIGPDPGGKKCIVYTEGSDRIGVLDVLPSWLLSVSTVPRAAQRALCGHWN